MLYLPWFLVSLFYAYQYVLRVLPNVLSSTLMNEFGIDAAVLGQVTGIYYIGYALGHIPIGYALDKYGPRLVATFGLLLALLGLLPLLFTKIWLFAAIGRFCTGVGSATAILSIFTVIRLTFPEGRFSQMLGFTATIGLLGAVYGGRPISWMIEQDSWQNVLSLLIVAGCILACLLWFFVPRKRVSSGDKTGAQDIKMIFQNRKILFLCVAGGLMVGPLEGFADAWGQAFLLGSQFVSKEAAIALTSLIFVGFGVGAPLLSLIADKTLAYYKTVKLCALFMICGFISLIVLQLNIHALTVLMFLIGVASAYQVFILYKTISYAPKSLAGQASAVGNMIIMIFGYLFHSLIGGAVHAAQTDPTNIDAWALKIGIIVIPVAQVIALLLLRRFKDHRS